MTRYAITEVHRDGVQHEIGRLGDLANALAARDGLKRAFTRNSAPLFLVHDSEDPERGYGEWLDCQKHGSFGDPDGWCEKCGEPLAEQMRTEYERQT